MMWRAAKRPDSRPRQSVTGRVSRRIGAFYPGNVALTLFKFETGIFLTDLI